MTPASSRSDLGAGPALYPWLALSLLNIALDRWSPGSLAASLAGSAAMGYFTIWFGLKIRKGIVIRRPHWTRESWLRYVRLAVMPVAAVAIVLYMSTERMMPSLGPQGSGTRMASLAVLLVLLVLGAGGLAVAVDWMVKGDPSLQFTRTRWFQRGTARASPPDGSA